MNLEQSFDVDAPIDQVWAALIDVERVAPCLPGAEITESEGDGVYTGTFQVKLGPTTAAYRGRLEMESIDEAAHVATMRANGQDKRGQGSAKATMVSTMTERDGGGTRVEVVTDFTITGRLARFGRGGMIKDVSNRLLRDFATCLQETLQASPKGGAGGDESERAAAPPTPERSEGANQSPGGPSGVAGIGAGGEQGSAPSVEAGSASAPRPMSAAGAARPDEPAERSAKPVSRPRTPAKPVNGIALVLSVLRERIKRLVGR